MYGNADTGKQWEGEEGSQSDEAHRHTHGEKNFQVCILNTISLFH